MNEFDQIRDPKDKVEVVWPINKGKSQATRFGSSRRERPNTGWPASMDALNSAIRS